MEISVSELLMRPEPDAGCSAIEEEEEEEEEGEEEEGEEEEEVEGGGGGGGGGGGDDDGDDYVLFALCIHISLLTRSSSDIPNMANTFSILNNEVTFFTLAE